MIMMKLRPSNFIIHLFQWLTTLFFTQSNMHAHRHRATELSHPRHLIYPLDTVTVYSPQGLFPWVDLPFPFPFSSRILKTVLEALSRPVGDSFFRLLYQLSNSFSVFFFVNNFGNKKNYLFTLFIALSMQNGLNHWCAEYITCSQRRCLWRWTYAMVLSCDINYCFVNKNWN